MLTGLLLDGDLVALFPMHLLLDEGGGPPGPPAPGESVREHTYLACCPPPAALHACMFASGPSAADFRPMVRSKFITAC